MTTRRDVIKMTAGAGLVVVSGSPTAPETIGNHTPEPMPRFTPISLEDQVPMIRIDARTAFRQRRWPEREKVGYLETGFDRDLDGSWTVYAHIPRVIEDDERGWDSTITVYDPVIANFLEHLFEMMEDPASFGHMKIGRSPYKST